MVNKFTSEEIYEAEISTLFCGLDVIEDYRSNPTELINRENPWMINGLRNGERHPCSVCSSSRTIFGFIPPLLLDLAKSRPNQFMVERDQDGLRFHAYNAESCLIQPALHLQKLSFYCQTGTSHDLRVVLGMKLYIHGSDGFTEHFWDQRIVKKPFVDRTKPARLNPEATRLINDENYHPFGRIVLQTIVERLALGPKKLLQISEKNLKISRSIIE
jgi:hypothetical protein